MQQSDHEKKKNCSITSYYIGETSFSVTWQIRSYIPLSLHDILPAHFHQFLCIYL